MKPLSILTLLPALALLAGCTETDDSLSHERAINAWMANALQGEAIDNAIVKQRTLYAYHFVDEMPRLNNLGRSDLKVLAAHYRRYPGSLSIRQGETPDDLYAERVDTVRQYLADSGVDLSEMVIEDKLPGGQGANNEQVITSLEEADEGLSGMQSAGSSTGGGSAGSRTRVQGGGMR